MGFREAFLKARGGRGIAGRVISSCTVVWLVDGEREEGGVPGDYIICPQAPAGLGLGTP